jgi:hypothetical protein
MEYYSSASFLKPWVSEEVDFSKEEESDLEAILYRY